MVVTTLWPVVLGVTLIASVWPWTVFYDRRASLRCVATGIVSSFLVVSSIYLGVAFGVLGTGTLRVGTLLPAALSWILWFRFGRKRISVGSRESMGTGPPWVAAMYVAVALTAYAGAVAIGLLVPPYGWDTLAYHLADVYQIASTGSLSRLVVPLQPFYFPQVAELHGLWAFLIAGASADAWRITGLALLPLNLIGAAGLAAACEALDLRASRPWIAAALLVTPLWLIQPLAGYVDAAFAGFGLAAFALLLWTAVEGRFAHLALGALAAGLALGVKVSFLFLVLPALLPLIGSRTAAALFGVGRRAVVPRVALLVLLFAVGSGPWLLRNALETGNPLYPTRVEVGGFALVDGPRGVRGASDQQDWFVEHPVEWARYPWYETFEGRAAYTLENGLGPLFAAGLVATIWMLGLAVRRRDALRARVLVALPLTLGLWWWLSPYREPRFAALAVGLALIGLAVLHEELVSASRSAWPGVVFQGSLLCAMIVSAAGGLLATPHLGQVVASTIRGDWEPIRYYELEYGQLGRAFNWIATRPGPARSVAFVRPDFIAPMFGWHGRHRPTFLAGPEDWGPGAEGRSMTYPEMRRALRRVDADWVVVWEPWWEGEPGRRAEQWIRDHPGDFRPLLDFGGKVAILEPLGLETLSRLPEAEPTDLRDLSQATAWSVEYLDGSAAELSSDASGRLQVDWSFGGSGASYADLRADLASGDWSGFDRLEFEVEVDRPGPVTFWIHLKNDDASQNCRFRWQPELHVPGRQRVSLPLAAPDGRTDRFTLSRVAELHLVLDDATDGGPGRGTFRAWGFRLSGNGGERVR